MQRLNRPRALRSRTPPPPRHPRQRLNPLLPPLLVVHIRRPAHRAPLRSPRHPTVPPNRQPTRCEQTLPPLHLLVAKSAEPAYPARQHKVLRLRVYPSLPLLNFLGLLLLSVERGDPSLWRQLKSHYAGDLKEVNWNEALDQIGEMYFGIKIPRQGNPMFDMLGSMFGGGMGGGGAAAPKKAVGGRPPAAGLD